MSRPTGNGTVGSTAAPVARTSLTRVLRRLGKTASWLALPLLDRCWQAPCGAGSIPGDFCRIYFFHIRKTGGTSVNHMFLALGGEDPGAVYRRLVKNVYHRTTSGGKTYVGWTKALIERGNYFYAFSHIPEHELRLPPQTFTITTLRDPIRRVMSHYKMLAGFRERGTRRALVATEGRWLGRSFHDFVDSIPEEHLQRTVYMFSRTLDVEEAFEKVISCSYWFFLEDFESGRCELERKLRVDLVSERRNTSGFELSLSDEEREYLMQRLGPELELYRRLKDYKQRAEAAMTGPNRLELRGEAAR